MIKKIFIILSFFCLFFINSSLVFAQEPPSSESQNTTEESEGMGFIQTILKAISDFFGYLIYGINHISGNYEAPASFNTKEKVNDYSSDVNDYSSRAIPDADSTRRKGVYFYEVLFRQNQPYENRVTKDAPDIHSNIDCPNEISIKDIVCSYANRYNTGQTSEQILYERGSLIPTDYSRVSGCSTLPNPDDCYINAYENYQDIPQGDFYGQKDTAALASTQANESIRTFLPESRQGDTAPDTNDTREKIDILVKDFDKQEENVYINFLPDEKINEISCDNNANLKRENLRQSFKCHLTPSYQNDESCDISSTIFDANQYICGDKVALNGPGISQRGAHGMALVGFNYGQIIQSYYGVGVTTAIKLGTDDKIVTVIMVDDTDFNADGISDNDVNCTSLVNRGRASNYDKADIEKGSGGVYSDGSTCVYIDDTPSPKDTEDPDITPTPREKKYKVKERSDLKNGDKCFSTITLNIHTYLLGIAEIFTTWHVEGQKAVMIAARGEALQFGSMFKNGSSVQVFQCNRVIENLKENLTNPLKPKVTNQRAAVDLTRDEVMVYTGTKDRISNSTHRSAFCGPGSSNPSFNGAKYETVSYLFNSGTIEKGKSIGGICFEGISYPLDDNETTKTLGVISDNSTNIRTPLLRSKTVSASQSGNLYYFNDQSRQTPIKENYDLIDVENGSRISPFPLQNSCQLDNRVFPALTSLIEKLKQDIPTDNLILKNCYRSFETQTELWDQGLSKYKDTYTNLMWHSYPGTSIHQTGRVIDFYDQKGRLNSSSLIYQWLIKNGSTYGFYHYKLEPWHWEYNP